MILARTTIAAAIALIAVPVSAAHQSANGPEGTAVTLTFDGVKTSG